MQRKNVVIWWFCFCVSWISIIDNESSAFAQSSITRANQIKAGFLLHFLSYTRWPKEQDNQLNLCLYGIDPFGSFIDDMIKSRPLTRDGTPISLNRKRVGDELTVCHILFASSQNITDLFWSSLPQNHAILLVSDHPDFTHMGGMVKFYTKNKKVRIEINLNQIQQVNLKVSAELLKLVKIIR